VAFLSRSGSTWGPHRVTIAEDTPGHYPGITLGTPGSCPQPGLGRGVAGDNFRTQSAGDPTLHGDAAARSHLIRISDILAFPGMRTRNRECRVPSPIDPMGWYDEHSDRLVGEYGALHPDEAHAWLNGLLPAQPALVFDIGAGTGREAAWLAARGHEVAAIEPSYAMRRHGLQLHQDGRIRWLDARLTYDHAAAWPRCRCYPLSGVWQHLPTADRPRAFRKLVTLLKTGGSLAITLRHGPAEPDVSPRG
jgi:SAM-dependent methyltransferase